MLATTDPKGFLRQFKSPVILDEIQRVPELLSYIQVIVDQKKANGQFILTGSHQYNWIVGQIMQSMAFFHEFMIKNSARKLLIQIIFKLTSKKMFGRLLTSRIYHYLKSSSNY